MSGNVRHTTATAAGTWELGEDGIARDVTGGRKSMNIRASIDKHSDGDNLMVSWDGGKKDEHGKYTASYFQAVPVEIVRALLEGPKAVKEPVMTREELKARHPNLKDLEFGAGWNRLMDKVATEFQKLQATYPNCLLTGGKEKYARLVLYVMNTDGSGVFNNPSIQSLREKAERLSQCICEDCGAPGTWRAYGWEKIHCDDCYDPSQENAGYDYEAEEVDLEKEFRP